MLREGATPDDAQAPGLGRWRRNGQGGFGHQDFGQGDFGQAKCVLGECWSETQGKELQGFTGRELGCGFVFPGRSSRSGGCILLLLPEKIEASLNISERREVTGS